MGTRWNASLPGSGQPAASWWDKCRLSDRPAVKQPALPWVHLVSSSRAVTYCAWRPRVGLASPRRGPGVSPMWPGPHGRHTRPAEASRFERERSAVWKQAGGWLTLLPYCPRRWDRIKSRTACGWGMECISSVPSVEAAVEMVRSPMPTMRWSRVWSISMERMSRGL